MGSAAVAEARGRAARPESVAAALPGPGGRGSLLAAATALHRSLRATPLPLDLPGTEVVRSERSHTIDQLADLVLPRLAEPAAPLLVVVAGPTGAGKSTLVNSLAGGPVTRAGLLRPTTRSPVLVHHPADRSWFEGDRILPVLGRVSHTGGDQRSLRLVASPAVLPGIALVDAPDFDSIDDGNREMAQKLIAAADLVLFVMSASRYSDRALWAQLDLVIETDTSVAVVLNRIPAGERAVVVPDFRRRLSSRSGRSTGLFLVDQTAGQDPPVLPASHVGLLRDWLDALAADTSARAEAADRTCLGALRRAVAVSATLAEAGDQQVAAIGRILAAADRVYAAELGTLAELVDSGGLVGGAIHLRWAELLGRPSAAEPLSLVEELALLRRRMSADPDDLTGDLDRLGVALDLTWENLVVDHAWRAADRASTELRTTAHGGALLDWSAEDLSRPGRRLVSRTRSALRAARRRVDAMAAAELDSALTSAELGARAAATALLIRAAGAPDDAQASSEEERLITSVRRTVSATLTTLLAEDRDRYLQPVLDWSLDADGPDRLRLAARRTDGALTDIERQGEGR